MNEKVLDFADKQGKKMLYTFIQQGYSYLDFREAAMYITLNAFVTTTFLKNGVDSPTDEHMYDAGINACDDVIRFFQGYKEKLINKEE